MLKRLRRRTQARPHRVGRRHRAARGDGVGRRRTPRAVPGLRHAPTPLHAPRGARRDRRRGPVDPRRRTESRGIRYGSRLSNNALSSILEGLFSGG